MILTQYHTNSEMLLSVVLLALFSFAVKAEYSESNEASSDQSHDDEIPRKFIEPILECSFKYDVPPTYFSMVLEGEAPEYENAKCFVKCSMMALNYLYEDGTFNEHVVKGLMERRFPDSIVRDLAINAWLKCEEQSHPLEHPKDSCERAYNLYMCYANNMSQIYKSHKPQ